MMLNYKAFLFCALTLLMFAQTATAQFAVVVEDQAEIQEGKYTILNNMYENPTALQSTWRWRDAKYNVWGWGSWFDKSDMDSINTPSVVLGWHWWTPDADTQLPTHLLNNDPILTRADWSIPVNGDPKLNVSYNLWFHDPSAADNGLDWRDTPKSKIGVWLHQEGGMSPQGNLEPGIVVIQGIEWELWRDLSGEWDVFTFRPKNGAVNNTELQLRDFIHEVLWLRNWMHYDTILSGVEFGTEVDHTHAPTEFHVGSFYIDVKTEAVPAPAPAPESPSSTMYVSGRHLYSATGERVVLRGVNAGLGWIEAERREEAIQEIGKSAANCLRIVWLRPEDLKYHSRTPQDLDNVIRQTIENNMIPMVMLLTPPSGRNLDKVSEMVDYWTSPEVVQVVNKYQRWMILNIANEAGNPAGESDNDFVSTYTDAINRIRDAGINVPLVIDATDFAQDYQQVFRTWEQIRDSDQGHSNVMFSLHTYWHGSTERKRGIYDDVISRVVADNIPLIFGEGPTPTDFQCIESPWEYGIQEMQTNGISWLAWSWGVVRNRDCGSDDSNRQDTNQFDITKPGAKNGDWNTDYAREIMVDNPNGIGNTSVRPDGLR